MVCLQLPQKSKRDMFNVLRVVTTIQMENRRLFQDSRCCLMHSWAGAGSFLPVPT